MSKVGSSGSGAGSVLVRGDGAVDVGGGRSSTTSRTGRGMKLSSEAAGRDTVGSSGKDIGGGNGLPGRESDSVGGSEVLGEREREGWREGGGIAGALN